MLSSDVSSSIFPDDLCSESPEKCLQYVQRENDQISEENEDLAKQVRILKDQFERAIDSSSGVEELVEDNRKLRAEIGKLQLERQDFAQRLKISLNSNRQITEDYKKKISEIEDSIAPIKQQYEAQISKLNLQIIHLKEIHEQTETDLSVLKAQANALLSLAQDVYDQPFFNLSALAEYVNKRESEMRKKLIEVETGAQNRIEKAENKAKKWKDRFSTHKAAADSNLHTLELELAREREEHESTLKTLENIRLQTPILTEKSVQSVDAQNDGIMQTPNISMNSELMSPLKAEPQKADGYSQNQQLDKMKLKLDQSINQLSEADMKYQSMQQNLVQAEDRVAQMAAELNKYKSLNLSMEQTINQLKDSHQTFMQTSLAKDESLREENRKALELARQQNEKSMRELESAKKDTEVTRQQLIDVQRERDSFKRKAEEYQNESEKNESKYKKSQQELEKMRDTLQLVTKDIKQSQEDFNKQTKTIKALQAKVVDKSKQVQTLEATIKQLKLRIQPQEKKKPTVTFTKPINWQEFKLSTEVMNEIGLQINSNMPERDQLELAIKIVSAHYLQKINKLVIESQEKTKSMVSQVQNIISAYSPNSNSATYAEMLGTIKRRLEQSNQLEQDVKEACRTCEVENIQELVSLFQTLYQQRKQMKKDLSKAKKAFEQLSQVLEDKENQINEAQREIESGKQTLKEKLNQIEELKATIETHKSQIAQLEEKQRVLNEEMLKQKHAHEAAQREKEFEMKELAQKIESQTAQIKEKEELVFKLQRERDEKESQLIAKDASMTVIKKQIDKIKKSRDKYSKSVKMMTNSIEDMKKNFRQKKKALREELRMQEQTLMERIRRETNEYTTTMMKMNFQLEKLQTENEALQAKTSEFMLEKQKLEAKKNAEINELMREKKAYEQQLRANMMMANRINQREQIQFTRIINE